MDPLAVHLAMTEAVEHMRARQRARPWSRPTPTASSTRTAASPAAPSATAPRRRSRQWRARDPLTQTADQLVRRGILSEEETAAGGQPGQGGAWTRSARCCSSRTRTASPASAGSGPPSGPTPPGSTSACAATCPSSTTPRWSPTSPPSPSTETKFIDAVAAVMARRMETDDGIVVMGEDVHRLNGGTNGATRGLHRALPRPGARHPDQRERLRRPGRRHRPRRPVHPGRRVHVRRLHVGRGRPAVQPDRQGAAHVRRHRRACRSCCAARSRWAPATARSTRWTRPGIFATSAGWRIVAPSTPYDYVGLMNTALRLQDPVRRAGARRPLHARRGPGRSTTGTTACRSARPRCAAPGSDLTSSPTSAMTPYVLERRRGVRTRSTPR